MTTGSILTGVREPNRWYLLALVGVAQLMVTLDVTIVNIALPTAQKALHFNTDMRQWAITAYAPAGRSTVTGCERAVPSWFSTKT